MEIGRFEFFDGVLDWTLEPTTFDSFNLLVGVSGAGKTRIVKALERVCAVALGTEKADEARGARFAIDFHHDGLPYHWGAETEPPAWSEAEGNGTKPAIEQPLIRREKIVQGERTIVERTPLGFELEGRAIPRIDRSKSAIAVLSEDPVMVPLRQAFSRILRGLENRPSHGANTQEQFEYDLKRYTSIDDLGADFGQPLHNKAELLQELFPDAFAEIGETFREAFHSVEEIKVLRIAPVRPATQIYFIYLAAKESGVANWVLFHQMSSGMQRFLSFLVHLSFAPRGTVVLIDELESSLGVNCLPAVTRFLLRRAPNLQFIITSHHPYIIEHIPPSMWKIVTRRGSHVRVLDAAKIPALQGRSHLDRFTRLLNLPEYEQGIQP